MVSNIESKIHQIWVAEGIKLVLWRSVLRPILQIFNGGLDVAIKTLLS